MNMLTSINRKADTREQERIDRTKEPQHREVVETIPINEDHWYNGQERMIKNQDGSHDLLKRFGNKTVRISDTLDGVKVIDAGGIIGIEVERNGKRYRIAMEEIDG